MAIGEDQPVVGHDEAAAGVGAGDGACAAAVVEHQQWLEAAIGQPDVRRELALVFEIEAAMVDLLACLGCGQAPSHLEIHRGRGILLLHIARQVGAR